MKVWSGTREELKLLADEEMTQYNVLVVEGITYKWVKGEEYGSPLGPGLLVVWDEKRGLQ